MKKVPIDFTQQMGFGGGLQEKEIDILKKQLLNMQPRTTT